MFHPGYGPSIFLRIRQEAGQKALSLARRLEKTTIKLEAHHRHLHFNHKALQNQFVPKSLRFKPPGSHPVFQQIMDRASKHCLQARIRICHDHIKSSKDNITNTKRELSSLINEDTYTSLLLFLKRRASSFHDNINARHAKKLANLNSVDSHKAIIDKKNWVVNLSDKPLLPTERSLLEKGPKFAPTPTNIPHKDIVAEIEASIRHLPDDSKDAVRTSSAAILHRARLPAHSNVSKEEKKALNNLKKDQSRVVMKADKGNCFVVMDRSDYDNKMETLLSDRSTYEIVSTSPFRRIERELNAMLLSLKRQHKIDEPTYRKLHSTDGTPPAIRGSVKHHKEGNPLRPIVTYMGSALYNTSKFLTDILSPLQNRNGYSVANSLQFSRELSDVEIDDDEVLVSFDVVSLFTAIPVDKACEYIKTKIEQDATLSSRTNLDIDDVIKLLQFTLSNNYFVFNDKIYKQVHGCAMGSPVSPVVANLCMEEIEESAISNSPVSPKIWKRYVDDSFCIIKKDHVSAFHDTLNSIDTNILFTIETECNEKISFLDTLVSRENGAVAVDVYRKPTHTDRYLDFNSHHDNQHKISTASTLLHRALNLPNSSEGKKRELDHVHTALKSNGYPSKFIQNIQAKKTRPPTSNVSQEELVRMFFEMVEPTESRKSFATLPYIKGLTEPLTRVLKKHDIKVVNKPFTTLQQQFPAPKSRPSMESQTNVVYKIPCMNCSWCYIGETGRAFNTRKKEHARNIKTAAKGSRIASHAWSNNHSIDFNNASIIDKGTFRTRKTLEAWHTKSTPNADNNSCPLPGQYNILFSKHS